MNRTIRKSGILLHITSLPGKYGCGTLGKESYDFIDFCEKAGYSVWQVLPICVPDEYDSPYASYGAFSGNPLLIDLEELASLGLLSFEEIRTCVQEQPYVAEFSKLRTTKYDILKLASSRLSNTQEIDDYMKKNPHVSFFCSTMAQKEGGDVSQNEKAWRFMEYTFFRQWKKMKTYAEEHHVLILGDIPIYVSASSSDLLECPKNFLVDDQGNRRYVAGFPPDEFSSEGQLWGNPLYNWDVMKADGYRWWKERLGFMFELFDGVRLDHFRGFASFYMVSSKATDAKRGKWKKGPGKEFVDVLAKMAKKQKKIMIAEDLGNITKEVSDLVDYSGFYSTRVLEFGFSDDDKRNKPFSYTENTVAYTGTHDNNTLLGFLFETDDYTRNNLFTYFDYHGTKYEEAVPVIRHQMLASATAIAIFPMQDILGYGSDTRMNRPGVANGNWSYRVTYEQLSSLNTEELFLENHRYGRI